MLLFCNHSNIMNLKLHTSKQQLTDTYVFFFLKKNASAMQAHIMFTNVITLTIVINFTCLTLSYSMNRL